jgi:hypothetical protein
MLWLLIIVALVFIAYAIFTQYSNTPTTQSKAARVWASLVAAAGALGALVMSWFQSGVSP